MTSVGSAIHVKAPHALLMDSDTDCDASALDPEGGCAITARVSLAGVGIVALPPRAANLAAIWRAFA